jgi:hypothetical protein
MNNPVATQQQILDNEHLKLLSIFHYVMGGISAVFACIPIIHVGIGVLFIVAPHVFGHGKDQPPAFVGWLLVVLGGFIIVLGWTFAALVLFAGRCIARRRHYTYCFVIACIECLSMPFGTVLGVFTILVLSRAAVREQFNLRAAGFGAA